MIPFLYPIITIIVFIIIWIVLKLSNFSKYINKKKEIDSIITFVIISVLVLGIFVPLITGCESYVIHYMRFRYSICNASGLFDPETNRFITRWAYLPLIILFVLWYKNKSKN
jgi:hypothetical protein